MVYLQGWIFLSLQLIYFLILKFCRNVYFCKSSEILYKSAESFKVWLIQFYMFVCLFIYMAALPTYSSQGALKVKDTCLCLVKEFRKGRKDRTTHMCSCWLVYRRLYSGSSLLSPSASTAQLIGETIQPQSLSNQIQILCHCDHHKHDNCKLNVVCMLHTWGSSYIIQPSYITPQRKSSEK